MVEKQFWKVSVLLITSGIFKFFFSLLEVFLLKVRANEP